MITLVAELSLNSIKTKVTIYLKQIQIKLNKKNSKLPKYISNYKLTLFQSIQTRLNL